MVNVLNNVDRVPSNVQFSREEALLCEFENNEAVIKMIIKGRSPTMGTCFQDPQRLLRLIGYSIESIWTQKSIVKHIEHQEPTCRHSNQKENFTHNEWNHLLCLFNISHFSCTVCSEAMAKIVQQDSGEERVTAKSRPMMSLTARAPSNLSSSASEKPREEKLWKSESLECRKLTNRLMIERGNPL